MSRFFASKHLCAARLSVVAFCVFISTSADCQTHYRPAALSSPASTPTATLGAQQPPPVNDSASAPQACPAMDWDKDIPTLDCSVYTETRSACEAYNAKVTELRCQVVKDAAAANAKASGPPSGWAIFSRRPTPQQVWERTITQQHLANERLSIRRQQLSIAVRSWVNGGFTGCPPNTVPPSGDQKTFDGYLGFDNQCSATPRLWSRDPSGIDVSNETCPDYTTFISSPFGNTCIWNLRSCPSGYQEKGKRCVKPDPDYSPVARERTTFALKINKRLRGEIIFLPGVHTPDTFVGVVAVSSQQLAPEVWRIAVPHLLKANEFNFGKQLYQEGFRKYALLDHGSVFAWNIGPDGFHPMPPSEVTPEFKAQLEASGMWIMENTMAIIASE